MGRDAVQRGWICIIGAGDLVMRLPEGSISPARMCRRWDAAGPGVPVSAPLPTRIYSALAGADRERSAHCIVDDDAGLLWIRVRAGQ
ncbi:MAG: hypothetical protein GX882_07320 [Methanomicrobiales archaeon]|nr:hypothetical protein [Methanomicrobiales archaeon]